MAAVLNLGDQEFLTNRREAYRAMRAHDPYAEVDINGEKSVILTRFRDLDAVLRFRHSVMHPAPGRFPKYIGDGAAARFYRASLPSLDSPEHAKLRRILSPSFTPQTIAQMEGWVAGIIDRRLSEIEDRPLIDIVSQLGDTIPVDVACRLLQIPHEDSAILVQRVMDITSILSQAPMTQAQVAVADSAAEVYYHYFEAMMDRAGSHTSDDFVGLLIRAERDGELSRDHVCTVLMDVFLASYHTTMVSFANAIHALALFPAARRVLHADPSMAARAWDEVLRYDSPVHFRHRYVREPLKLEGYTVEPGTKIMLALASANWDEAAFENPDEFSLARKETRHMAFGGGGHFCLGSALSRLEGKYFLPGFLRRFPNFRLVPERSARNDNLTFPHFSQLTIEMTHA